MKTKIQYGILALMILFAAPAKAQEAFYIYQNDGHFDGFFYDQVQKISYSKLDTLGVEHPDYVSQEIVTADSTYRIMLTAIDSVSFVQPEIKFNPHMRDIRKEGMIEYMTARDDNSVTFSSTMPEALRPREGDVLVDFDIEEGFSLRVKSVSAGSSIVATCEDIESVHDIYEQLICVEQYGADKAGNLTRRRVAGRPELNVGYAPRKTDFNYNLFNFSLSGHIPLYSDSIDGGSVTLDANISTAADLKAVWNFPGSYDRLIHGKKDYVGLTLTLNNDISAGITIDCKINDEFTPKLSKLGQLPIPAAAPILVFNFGPDGFIRGEVHAKVGWESPKFKSKLWYKFELDDWSPSVNFGHGNPPGEPEEEPDEENTQSASFEFNGYAQAGVKFPLKLFTNKLLEKIVRVEVGTDVYVGPKISGAISVDLKDVAENGLNAYGNLKDTKLSLSYISIDYETTAKMGALWGVNKEVTLADGSFDLLGSIDCYMFPDFGNWQIVEDEKPYWNGRGNFARVTPSRNVIIPVKVGIITYRKNVDELIKEETTWFPEYYYQLKSGWRHKKNHLQAPVYELPSGEYQFKPIISFLGMEIPANQVFEYTVPGPFLDVPYTTTVLKPDKNTESVAINGNDLSEVTSVDHSWLWKKSITDKQLNVGYVPKGGLLPAETSLTLKMLKEVKDGDSIFIEKNVPFRMEPNYTVSHFKLEANEVVDVSSTFTQLTDSTVELTIRYSPPYDPQIVTEERGSIQGRTNSSSTVDASIDYHFTIDTKHKKVITGVRKTSFTESWMESDGEDGTIQCIRKGEETATGTGYIQNPNLEKGSEYIYLDYNNFSSSYTYTRGGATEDYVEGDLNLTELPSHYKNANLYLLW